MTWAGIAVGGIGAVASGVGGALGASSSNRAVSTQTQAQKSNTFSGVLTQGMGLWGGAYAGLFQKINDAVWAQVNHGDNGPLSQLAQTPEFQKWQQDTGGAAIPQLRQIAAQYAKTGNAELRRFDSETAGMKGQENSLSQLMDTYGANRDNIIRTDASRALQGANNTATASMNASGLGSSTLIANQLAGNQVNNNREMQRQLQNSADQRIDRQTAVRTGNINRDQARSGARQSLWGSLQDRNLNMSMAPVNASVGGLNNIGNMWAGAPVAGGGGLSPVGSALSNLGNAAAGYGSLLSMSNIFRQQAPAGGGVQMSGIGSGGYGANGTFA